MAKDGGPNIVMLLLLGGAAYVAYQFFFSSASAASSSATPTPALPPAPNIPQVPGQLASLFNNVVAAATKDAMGGDKANQLTLQNGVPQTTWDAWNYFMGKVAPNLTGLPAYQDATGNQDPGLPLTPSQYWAVMGPWLTKNKGLSGAMAGLGALYSIGAR
jgi:hypothetical protein